MEYDTCLRHNLPITVVMGNDSNWGIDKTFQLAYYNRAVGTDLQFRRYDRVVEALGGHAEFVENAEDVAPAVDRAINSGLPSLVNVVVKPGASPLADAMIARRTGR
jgi:acetolactate synthase-1/2/3 large subunit